eukprot:COSAG02_NODE_99_length_37069_cov_24.910957_31_plen_72_part_00
MLREKHYSCGEKMPKRSKSKKQQPVIIPVDSEDKQGLDPLPPQDHPWPERVVLLYSSTGTYNNTLVYVYSL